MKMVRIIGAVVVVVISSTCLAGDVTGAGIEWDILNQEVMELYRKGEYARGVVLARKTLQIAEQNAGPDHPDVATSLNNLALLYPETGIAG